MKTNIESNELNKDLPLQTEERSILDSESDAPSDSIRSSPQLEKSIPVSQKQKTSKVNDSTV